MDIKAFRGLSGTYNVKANERNRGTPRNIECLVQFLDNTQHKFILDRRSKGQTLLDCVFQHLNLFEIDFFGLKFTPHETNHSHQQLTPSLCGPQNLNFACNNTTTINVNAINGNDQNNGTSSNHKIIQPGKALSIHSFDNSPSSNVSVSSAAAINPVPPNHSTSNHNHTGLETEWPTSSSIAGDKNYKSNNNSNSNLQVLVNSTLQKCNSNSSKNDSASVKFAEERWLDPTKSIRKQYKSASPYKFYFKVKFYVSDPGKLADDITRNHLYLQLRQDIWNNKLSMPTCSAILLASYILQSEVGDFRRELLEENYASKYRLLPNLSEDIKRKIIELHKQHKSLSAADAEYQFLEHAAKKLDDYGVEYFDAKDSCKEPVKIGVSSNGIVILKDRKKIGQYSWAKIIKIMFKKKIFSIQLRKDEKDYCDNNFIEYNLLTNQACKSFWEECVAQHSFFRLHQPKSPPKKFFSFLNFGSKFQYNGKTEYQTMEESRKRTFSHFSRTPSKRYARRTIPIGRPSWSEPNNQQNGEKFSSAESEPSTEPNIDSNDAAWLLAAPIPSSSGLVAKTINETASNGVEIESQAAYRPKSLTLKSFMYIDEPKTIAAAHGNVTPTANLGTNEVAVIKRVACESTQEPTIPQAQKRDLKRSESLRIPNSLRGAISLTKKAGVTSGSQLARISESLRDKFSVGKPRTRKTTKRDESAIDQDLETSSETSLKVVNLTPGPDGKYGFKIRKTSLPTDSVNKGKSKKHRVIIICDVSPQSPAATCNPRLAEGDRIVSVNGMLIDGLTESKVENLIKNIQQQNPPILSLELYTKSHVDAASSDSLSSRSEDMHSSPASISSNTKSGNCETLADSIKIIKVGLESKELIEAFEKLSRKSEDETSDESKLMENIDKNRYRDILPYDSTRVQLIDSMTGDYINASFVNMTAPSGMVNRYIATQGPLASTCDDFWQMIWEQNSSLIIMVTPLVEASRVKCHKYWPDEREECRYGQLIVRNINEKSRSATIDRTIQLMDVKSGEKKTTTQIQYKAWPDHEIPEDCSDFLKLVNRVRKHRRRKPHEPIVVHCSAGIGRTGVLILMETAICVMESGEPIYPIKILEDMRKQRAMLIQTNSQFQFVASAICRVYDQRLYKGARRHRKK